MKLTPEILIQKGRPAFVKLPYKQFTWLASLLEDRQDEEDAEIIWEERTGERSYPANIARAIAAGENPVRICRQWRGLTQEELAAEAGVTPMYISHLENDVRYPSVKLARKLANSLDVDWDIFIKN